MSAFGTSPKYVVFGGGRVGVGVLWWALKEIAHLHPYGA
jgi:hypothetical protein